MRLRVRHDGVLASARDHSAVRAAWRRAGVRSLAATGSAVERVPRAVGSPPAAVDAALTQARECVEHFMRSRPARNQYLVRAYFVLGR